MLSDSSKDTENETNKTEVENNETQIRNASKDDFIAFDSDGSDISCLRCFKTIDISSSSIFRQPFYFFPDLEDPGIYEACTCELTIEVDHNIGREKYINICKTLGIPPLKRVLTSLDQDELDLRYYGLRSKEFRSIFNALEFNSHVKKLLLEDSTMEEESVIILSHMLGQNMTIKVLNLKLCEIGPKNCSFLNEGLSSTTTLRDLDLSFNSIGDVGLKNLLPSLLNNDSIVRLNLGHNNLTSVSAKYLQQYFSVNELIEDINLEWNFLNDDGAIKKIVSGLMQNKYLVSVNLSWNALESRVVAKEIGKFVQQSQTLEFLDLSNNRFKGSPFVILKKAISANNTLIHVNLSNNPLNVTEAKVAGTLLLEHPTLKILNIDNILIPKVFKRNLKTIANLGKTLIHGGILGNYTIKGPNVKHVLLTRCHYLGLAPKRAKAKREFGIILLTMPEKPMNKSDFEKFVRKKKKAKMYDLDLLDEVKNHFSTDDGKVDPKKLLSEYLKLYPDVTLPPVKKKKGKKEKKVKVKAVRSRSKSQMETIPTTATTETSGATTDITGTTTEISGRTTQISGTTMGISGAPTEISGAPTEISGATTEISGATTEISGEPTERSGITTTVTETDDLDKDRKSESSKEIKMETQGFESDKMITDQIPIASKEDRKFEVTQKPISALKIKTQDTHSIHSVSFEDKEKIKTERSGNLKTATEEMDKRETSVKISKHIQVFGESQ